VPTAGMISMTLAAELISGIKEILNTTIYIPVITPLLRKLGVKDFSFLDAVSLIIAIPVTVMFKVITGKPPSGSKILTTTPWLEAHSTRSRCWRIMKLHRILISHTMFTTVISSCKIITAKVPKPTTFSYATLTLDIIKAIGTFPYDKLAPAREVRYVLSFFIPFVP
jgi:hypothetical protein